MTTTTANVGGVFLVLGVGCFVALIVAIIEFLLNVNKIAIEARVSVIVGGWKERKNFKLFHHRKLSLLLTTLQPRNSGQSSSSFS